MDEIFLNLHLLRAAAALAVVYFHTTSDAGLNFPIHVGAHGVDVFFVRQPLHHRLRRRVHAGPISPAPDWTDRACL